jgi:CheY-like chemotaxis protein
MAKILIVNDEPDLVEVSRMILEAAGYEVVKTVDGTHAVDLARHEAPDAILLDFVLSGTDGGRVMQVLRADEVLRATPVVMMSALQDGAERARRAGADAFLQKPFTADELVDAVAQLLVPPSASSPGDATGGGRISD